MLLRTKELTNGLKKFKLSKKNIGVIEEIVEKQIVLYKSLQLDLSKVSLIIVGKKIEGVDTIRVFENNSVLLEILDTSYTRLKNLSSLEDWNTSFIFWVSFLENGEYIEIAKYKLSDIASINCKKVKTLTYGISDGEDAIKLEISQQDIKGVEYEVLRNAVAHTFKKETGKNVKELNCVVIDYS